MCGLGTYIDLDGWHMTQNSYVDLVASAGRRLQFAIGAIVSGAQDISEAGVRVGEAIAAGGKILICGNGGSAACSQHFAAEFVGKLKMPRTALPAISLTTDTSAITAIANDFGYNNVFARQVEALATAGDVVVGLSTSGTSENVRRAIAAGKQAGAFTLALTGSVSNLGAHQTITVPISETARIQEAHDLILHEIAQIAERVLVPSLDWDPASCPFPFILTNSDLLGFRDWIETTGQSLVTTNGCFDLLHRGHRSSLAQSRAFGDRLVVLLNSDDSAARLKGPGRPVRSFEDRADDLCLVPAVDHVVEMVEDDPRRLLAELRPHVHAKGSDYAGTELIEEATVKEHGGRIKLLPLLGDYSTTRQLAGGASA
jgi:rfaE bifunctional protein nucleotidyltransferase chain/domain